MFWTLWKKIFLNHKFYLWFFFSEELENEELFNRLYSWKKVFINTTNSFTKDLPITSSTEIKKAMFKKCPRKIYCLQKVKKKKKKQKKLKKKN